jgi:hypothetical protein
MLHQRLIWKWGIWCLIFGKGLSDCTGNCACIYALNTSRSPDWYEPDPRRSCIFLMHIARLLASWNILLSGTYWQNARPDEPHAWALVPLPQISSRQPEPTPISRKSWPLKYIIMHIKAIGCYSPRQPQAILLSFHNYQWLLEHLKWATWEKYRTYAENQIQPVCLANSVIFHRKSRWSCLQLGIP